MKRMVRTFQYRKNELWNILVKSMQQTVTFMPEDYSLDWDGKSDVIRMIGPEFTQEQIRLFRNFVDKKRVYMGLMTTINLKPLDGERLVLELSMVDMYVTCPV